MLLTALAAGFNLLGRLGFVDRAAVIAIDEGVGSEGGIDVVVGGVHIFYFKSSWYCPVSDQF